MTKKNFFEKKIVGSISNGLDLPPFQFGTTIRKKVWAPPLGPGIYGGKIVTGGPRKKMFFWGEIFFFLNVLKGGHKIIFLKK